MALLDLDYIRRLLNGEDEEPANVPVPQQRPIDALVNGPQETVRDLVVPKEQPAEERPGFFSRIFNREGETEDEAARREALGLALMQGGGAMMMASGPSLQPTNFMTALGAGTSQFANAYGGLRGDAAKQAAYRRKEQQEAKALEANQQIAQLMGGNGNYTPEQLMALAQQLMASGQTEEAIKVAGWADTLRQGLAKDGRQLDAEGNVVNTPGLVDSSAEIKRSDAAATQEGTESQIRTNDQREADRINEQRKNQGLDPITDEQLRIQTQRTTDQKDYEYYSTQELEAGRQPKSFDEWSKSTKASGRTQVNVNTVEGAEQAADLEFGKKAAATQATMFGKMAEDYPVARQNKAKLGQLRGALANNNGGWRSGLQQYASEWGIKVGDNASDLEYANALINQMVPEQRPPGSGAMSDADLALFKSSVPQLMNTPEGNKLILDTMEAMTDYRMKVSEISNRAISGEITRQEANKQMLELADPMLAFKESTKPAVGTQDNPVPLENEDDPRLDTLPAGSYVIINGKSFRVE